MRTKMKTAKFKDKAKTIDGQPRLMMSLMHLCYHWINIT